MTTFDHVLMFYTPQEENATCIKKIFYFKFIQKNQDKA